MRISLQDLYDVNTWWSDRDWTEKDINITDWKGAEFKWTPRLCRTFEDADVVYTMRGPRRVGKTTLLKLKVMDLIDKGIPPKNIFYLSCDLLESPKQLLSAIEAYLIQVRGQAGGRTYLLIDEVSALRNWQKALKVIIDSGKARGCTMILTGSHSIDVRKASETLAGRRGEAGGLRYGSPDKILLPLKFSEYAETRSPEVKRVLREHKALSAEVRKSMLKAILAGETPPFIEALMSLSRLLEGLLEDYFVTGGMPQAIREFLARRTISDATYAGMIELVMRDIARWGGNETFARQVLWRVSETFGSRVSWDGLRSETDMGDHRTVERYVEMLKDSFVLSRCHRLDAAKGRGLLRKEVKVYFVDPFILHACRGWISGKRAFDYCQGFLESPEERGRLAEQVVGNHIARLAYGMQPSPLFEASSAVFHWVSRKRRELDFAFGVEGKYVPVEVKYASKVRKEDAYGIYDFMKTGASHGRGIIVTRDSLRFQRGVAEVPCHLFLMLA